MKGETWALWSINGEQIIGSVQMTEGEIENLPPERWITIERACVLTIQIGMTQRGPAVAPVALPYGASCDEQARVRVPMRAVSSIWWFSAMTDKVRSEMNKRVSEAARAASALAASAAGILT